MIKRFSDNTMLVTGGAAEPKPVKTFESGKRVCEFGVAADYKDGQTVWCNIKAWGYMADVAARVRKGDQVFVTGRYEENEKDGKVYKACVADAIIGASGAEHEQHGDAYEPGAPSTAGADDELPF
jgi:hypothetical protein